MALYTSGPKVPYLPWKHAQLLPEAQMSIFTKETSSSVTLSIARPGKLLHFLVSIQPTCAPYCTWCRSAGQTSENIAGISSVPEKLGCCTCSQNSMSYNERSGYASIYIVLKNFVCTIRTLHRCLPKALFDANEKQWQLQCLQSSYSRISNAHLYN